MNIKAHECLVNKFLSEKDSVDEHGDREEAYKFWTHFDEGFVYLYYLDFSSCQVTNTWW